MRIKEFFSLLLLFAVLFPGVCFAEPAGPAAPAQEPSKVQASPAPPKSLAEELAGMKDLFVRNSTPEKVKDYEDAIQEIRGSGILDKAVKAGDKAPDFELPNLKGETTSLAGLLEKGPLILVWYRGGWCPYCSLELNAWQNVYSRLQKAGIGLAVVSPEVSEQGVLTGQRNYLSFEILTDAGNGAAKKYGLVYKIPDRLLGYLKGKLDFKNHYGDEAHEFPISATYVIDPQGQVRLAFLDPDWRNRAEPSRILQLLNVPPEART